jgi:hypothetical protein
LNLPALKKVTIGSSVDPIALGRLLLQFINYVAEAINPLLARPRSFSVSQSVDLVAATPKVVSHKLPLRTGQVPTGWLVTDIDANTTVRRNDWDDKTITIQAAADCTVILEVW